MSRDADFTLEVKQLAAERAGFLCARPQCPNPYTFGPRSDEKRTCVGDAAHIHAASPSGPRYDSTKSVEELKSLANAIWLCARCHRIVDADGSRFVTTELLAWKEQAEENARARVEGYGPDPGMRVPDLLPPAAGFWRMGLIAVFPGRVLGVAFTEQALRAAIDQTRSIFIDPARGAVIPVRLDEDGLWAEMAETRARLRARATLAGHLDVSITMPLCATASTDGAARGLVDTVHVFLAASVLMRIYFVYGRAVGGMQNTLPAYRQLFLLDIEGTEIQASSELLGGGGGVVGRATVNYAATPVAQPTWGSPVGGLPANQQAVESILELLAFFRTDSGGVMLHPNVVARECQRYF